MLKKFLSLVLSLLLIISLVACGGGLPADSLGSGNDSPVSSGGVSNANLKEQIQNCTALVDYATNTTVDQMDTITFGLDPNSDPIEWIVLEKEGNKALLLSKYILGSTVYNDEDGDITWEKCSLREQLNSVFIDSVFSKKEKNSILTTNVVNSDNAEYGTKGGNNTKDKVFLLSIDEFKKYFNGDKKRSVGPLKNTESESKSWWLRSPGKYQDNAAEVNHDGSLREAGIYVYEAMFGSGVRPALWVKY